MSVLGGCSSFLLFYYSGGLWLNCNISNIHLHLFWTYKWRFRTNLYFLVILYISIPAWRKKTWKSNVMSFTLLHFELLVHCDFLRQRYYQSDQPNIPQLSVTLRGHEGSWVSGFGREFSGLVHNNKYTPTSQSVSLILPHTWEDDLTGYKTVNPPQAAKTATNPQSECDSPETFIVLCEIHNQESLLLVHLIP